MGGEVAIIMKGGNYQMKSRCGFYSKLGYCEGGTSPPPPPQVDETLL